MRHETIIRADIDRNDLENFRNPFDRCLAFEGYGWELIENLTAQRDMLAEACALMVFDYAEEGLAPRTKGDTISFIQDAVVEEAKE